MKCVNCGSEINEFATFCPFCGSDCQQSLQNHIEEKEKRKKEKKKKSSKRWFVFLVIIALIAICFALYTGTDAYKYKHARVLLYQYDYEGAIHLLESMDEYKDSEELLVSSEYSYAKNLMHKGDFDLAEEYLRKIEQYKDAKELIKESDALKKIQGTWSRIYENQSNSKYKYGDAYGEEDVIFVGTNAYDVLTSYNTVKSENGIYPERGSVKNRSVNKSSMGIVFVDNTYKKFSIQVLKESEKENPRSYYELIDENTLQYYILSDESGKYKKNFKYKLSSDSTDIPENYIGG